MIGLSPTAVAGAYSRVASGQADTGPSASGAAFGDLLRGALDSAVASGRQADTLSAQAITGEANLTQVTTAVTRAELALNTATAIRDRMMQAYQDIMRMPV